MTNMNHRELLAEYLGAYNAMDVPRMLALFSEDCLFENISAGKVTVRTEGKTDLEALARTSGSAFASREQKVLSMIQDGERICAEIDFRGILQADLSPDFRAGTEMRLRGVSVLEFKDGKIVRLSDYS